METDGMCSAVKRRKNKKKRKPAPKKVLKISHFWAKPEQEPIDALIKRFERKHPEIKIQQNVMDWWTYTAAIKRQVFEVPSDVIVCDIGETLISLAADDRLADLTDIWKTRGFFDVFPKWMGEKCGFRGKMYGVPSKYFTYAIWYLTDVFKDHGIRPPRTWDEFLKVCRSFKEAGVHPIVTSGDGTVDWFMNLLAKIGGAPFYNGLVQGTESWRDPRVIKAYEVLRDLSRDYFYPHPFGFNSPMAWVRLNNREAAMHLQGDWVNGMWQRQYGYTPGKEYDYFLIPPIDPKIGQVMVVGGNAWVIPKNAPRRAQAKAFVEYAGSLEAHEIMARKGIGILAHPNVSKKAYDSISAKLREEVAAYPTVPNAGAAFPLKIYSVIQVQNMKILLNPAIKREGIENLTTEIEIVAKEHHMLKSLNSLREYFS